MSWKSRVVILLFAGGVSCCSPVVLTTSRQPAPGLPENISQADTQCSYYYYLVGRSAELNGYEHYEEAVEAYEKALTCDERATHIMRNLAELLLQMNRRQHALDWLEKILALDPTDLQTVSLVANIYASEGKTAEAIGVYQRLLDREPNNQQALLLLGTFYARHRQYEKAKQILGKLLSLNSKSADGYFYLAKLYRELKLYDRAAKYYEKSLSLRWSTLTAIEAADFLERLSRYREAEKLYLRMLDQDEANEHARLRLAEIYARLGEVDKAVDMLQELKEYSMEPQQVDLAIGRILVENNRLDEAETHFKQMIANYPEFEPARSLLAMVYYEKGEKEQAVKQLEAIPRDSDSYADAVVMRVRMLVEMKDYQQAESILTEAIKSGLEPLSKMYTLLASLYQKVGRIDDARKIFQQALTLFADDYQVLFEYGIFLDKTGDQKGALETMQKVLELNPDDPYALNYIGYTWADKGIQLEKAEQYLQKAVQQLPKDGFVRDSLGWAYFKLGKMDAAIRELEVASELEPEDPTIAEHLGDAYAGKGDIESAEKNYQRAIKLYTKEEKRQEVREKLQDLPQTLPAVK
ncbi:MAG: tetratricopeptide repeat protein [Deltaproteobacteria bacterium]